MKTFDRIGVVVMLALAGSLPMSHGADARAAVRPMRMTIGDPNAGHIDIAIDRPGVTVSRIAIDMHRVGAPGSRFTLSIGDRPVVASFILTDKQCRFDAAGSRCTILIERRDQAFKPLLAAFKSGRRARVTVENAGNIAMSREVSLRPFAVSLRRP